MSRSATTKHTVTRTRELQAEVQEVFGEVATFRLDRVAYDTKDDYALFWNELFVSYFQSRKAAHEWVMKQIELRRELLARPVETVETETQEEVNQPTTGDKAMNAQEKAELVSSFCDSVKNEVTSKINNMPDEWDGLELKQLIVEIFSLEETKDLMGKRRYKEFRSEVYNRSLR